MRVTSVMGQRGLKGEKGDPGAASTIAGPKGDTGAAGANGTNGTNATTTSIATQSANGLLSSADKKKIDGLLRRTLTTDVNGLVTWTFNPPFATGVTPVIEVAPQSATAGLTINHRISALTNTAVTVQLSASAAVTVLGISVLGVQQPGAIVVHLTAGDPTAA